MSSNLLPGLGDQGHNPMQSQIHANAKFIKDLFDSPSMKKSTRKNLRSDWASWMRFIENDIGMNVFSSMSFDDQLLPLMGYCQYLVNKNLKAITVRRRLSGLSTMLRLLGINDGVTGTLDFPFMSKTYYRLSPHPALRQNR